MIQIKNLSGAINSLHLHEFQIDEVYDIPKVEESSWSENDDVLIAISSGDIQIQDSGTPVVGISNQIDFLKGNVPAKVLIQNEPSIIVSSQTPFKSKSLVINGVTKKLYARNTGVQYSVAIGSNVLEYTMTYPWSKILGVEVINCEVLDTVDFEVYDNATGTYSGVPNLFLNKFSYTLNLSKDYYERSSQFDADIYVGMVIKITYVSVSAKTVGINLLINEVK